MSTARAASSPRSTPRRSDAVRAWAAPLAGAIALIAAWQVASDAGLRERGVLASPTRIAAEIAGAPAVYGHAVLATLGTAAVGWLIGQVVAITFLQVRLIEKLLLQLALAVVCVPLVAVLQIAFDQSTTKIVLAAVSVFFPTLISTIVGLRSADANLVTLMASWGSPSWQVLLRVRLPTALPGIVTGLQVGIPAALLGTVLGEFSGSESGLGTLIVTGLFKMDVEMTWAVAVIATVLTTGLYAFVGAAGRAATPWSAGIATAAARGSTRARVTGVMASLGWGVLATCVVLAAWWGFIAVLGLSPFFAKSPADVFAFLVTAPDAGQNLQTLLGPLGVTLTHALLGYGAGLAVGIATATVFAAVPVVERTLLPLTLTLRSVPLPVLLPVVIMMFGRGLAGVAVLCAIVTFFPTLANVSAGLTRTPRDALLLFQSYDSSLAATYARARFPFAMPSLLASARIAAPAALLAATLAEWLATGDGLGNLMVTARASQQFTVLWSAAAVLTAIAVLFYTIVSALEGVVLRRFGAS